MLLSNDLMLDPCAAVDVDNGLMVLRDPVRANNIVLALGQPRGSWCRGREAAGVLEVEELLQVGLGRLLQEDLTEADGDIGMSLDDNITGPLGLIDGEDGERVGNHCGGCK